MRTTTIRAIVEQLGASVREYVGRALAPLEVRLAGVETRAPIPGPTGERGDVGPRGERGAPGEVGPAGQKGDTGPAGPAGERGESGAPGPAGERGVPGPMGETGPEGRQGPQGERGIPGESGSAGPQGSAGEKGEQGPIGPAGTEGQQGPTGAQGPAGERGAVGEPGPVGEKGERGEPGPVGATGPRGEKGGIGEPGQEGPRGPAGDRGEKGDPGRDGRDGQDGLDAAQIEPVMALDGLRSYARGTWACHRGGMIRAMRTTDPLDGRDLASAGWAVIWNGVAEMESVEDGQRSFGFLLRMTDGREVRHVKTFAVPLYREVYREGETYTAGDNVTWDGSLWAATKDAPGRPGAAGSGWRLAVKHGRAGKDGKDGERGPPGPDGRPGKDLTRIAPDGSRY